MTASTWEQPSAQQLLATFGGPAFVRRARQCEAVWQEALEAAAQQRQVWLEQPQWRLARLRTLAGDWDCLRPLLAEPAQLADLIHWDAVWQRKLRAPCHRTESSRPLRQALLDVQQVFATFNRRWSTYLAERDWSELNRLRQEYNQFYLLEKECALSSWSVVQKGYRPLPPATSNDLLMVLPHLPEILLSKT